ncbi:hypothetical protein RF11_06948 [Thelohanellus kitauei]|uniref:Uncharacterized protein n=1 Tax=Thelohanellus kitauei TaxID=669202 RepID=A0A0C2MC52_THEKT|nr:hypothetical protein RF11_06948 [Thelohanellus kitauei]
MQATTNDAIISLRIENFARNDTEKHQKQADFDGRVIVNGNASTSMGTLSGSQSQTEKGLPLVIMVKNDTLRVEINIDYKSGVPYKDVKTDGPLNEEKINYRLK